MASRRVPKKVLRSEFVSEWNTDGDILDVLEDKDDEYEEPLRKRRRTTRASGDVGPKQSRKRVAPVSVLDSVAELGSADTIVMGPSGLSLATPAVDAKPTELAYVGPSGLSGFTLDGFAPAVDAKPTELAYGCPSGLSGFTLSGFTPAVDTKPTELASVLGEAGGDPARHAADTGRPVRKSQKRGTGPEPVRPTRTGASQPVPVSAGEDPAEWSNEIGDGLIELLENETDEIGDSLIELLENGTSDGLSEMWDEEAEELPEPTEAGGELERAPWTPKVWLDAFLECTDVSPLVPAIRQMIDDCNLMSHREASQNVLGWVDTESSTWPSHYRLVDEI